MKTIREFLISETKEEMRKNNLIDYKNLVDYFIKNDIHNFQFKKLNEKDQEIVTNLINKIIHNNNDLFKNYKDYQDTLKTLYEIKTDRNYAYKVKGMDIPFDEWYQNQKDDIDIRIANGILKELKQDIPKDKNIKNDIFDLDTKEKNIDSSNLSKDSNNVNNENEELDFESEFIDNTVLDAVKESVNNALANSLLKNIEKYDANAPNDILMILKMKLLKVNIQNQILT